MKNKVKGAVCAAVLCLATAGLAQQGTTPSGTQNQRTIVTGSIVSVGSDVIVVRTDAGETMSFNRDASINVSPDLMAGSRVSVEYDRLAGDNLRLSRIELTQAAGIQGTTSGAMSGSTTGERAATPSTSASSSTGDDRLPQTASPLAMFALAGLVSLGGAMALRARRRR